MNITKDEMLNYHLGNIANVLNRSNIPLNNLKNARTLIKKMFELNNFDLFMDLVNERFSNDKPLFLFNNSSTGSNPVIILHNDGISSSGVAFTKSGALRIIDEVFNKHAFNIEGEVIQMVDKNTSKENLMEALFESNIIGGSYYLFNQFDYINADFTQKEMVLLKKLFDAQNKNWDQYDLITRDLSPCLGFLDKNFYDFYKSKYRETNYIQSNYANSIIDNVDKINKLILLGQKEEKKSNTEILQYIFTGNRFMNFYEQLINRSFHWDEENIKNACVYLESVNKATSLGIVFFHNKDLKEHIEYMINDYISNINSIEKECSPIYKLLLADEILLLNTNLKNSRETTINICSDIEKIIKDNGNRLLDYQYDFEPYKDKQKKIIETWINYYKKPEDVIVIKEIKIKMAKNKIHSKLDLNYFKTKLDGKYISINLLNKDFLIEIKNDNDGVPLLDKKIVEDLILLYFEERKDEKDINFDRFIREILLKEKIHENELSKNEINKNKKKI